MVLFLGHVGTEEKSLGDWLLRACSSCCTKLCWNPVQGLHVQFPQMSKYLMANNIFIRRSEETQLRLPKRYLKTGRTIFQVKTNYASKYRTEMYGEFPTRDSNAEMTKAEQVQLRHLPAGVTRQTNTIS